MRVLEQASVTIYREQRRAEHDSAADAASKLSEQEFITRANRRV